MTMRLSAAGLQKLGVRRSKNAITLY